MRELILCPLLILCVAGPLRGAERRFDFNGMPTNQPPADCFSIVGGEGKPGTWKVIMDELPPALPPLSSNAPGAAPKAVVAQLARDATDEHFPMLTLGNDSYGDFTLNTRFKIVDGLTEQMAGIAFRIQDEKNYYYVRASALANTFYFYTVKNGAREEPKGNEIKIGKGVWHDLTVECAGPRIHILMDGKEALPTITNPTFSAGRVAFWTKSDSISYFTDARITYTPREPYAQLVLRDVLKENPRLLGLKVLMAPPKAAEIRIVASNDEKEIGQPGEKTDADVINRGVNYYRKEKEIVYVTMPLRDRNGDAVAAVRFVMKSFPGQTEQSALVRAMPMLKKMQQRASAVDSLY